MPAGTRTCRSTRARRCRTSDPRVRAYVDAAGAQQPAGRRSADRQDLLRRPPRRRSAYRSFRFFRRSRARGPAPRRSLRHSHARRRGARASLGRHGARIRAPARDAALELSRVGSSCSRSARGRRCRTSAGHSHMRGDLERLDRVAHRFERIGREPKFEPIDVAEIVERRRALFPGARSDARQYDRRRDRGVRRICAAFTATPCCSSGRSKC